MGVFSVIIPVTTFYTIYLLIAALIVPSKVSLLAFSSYTMASNIVMLKFLNLLFYEVLP